MSKILVTGGCGYIGSHTIVDLLEKGFEVISVDSLVNSEASVLNGIAEITGQKVINYTYDLCDRALVDSIFEAHPDIEGIIHFAALKAVGESTEKPGLYFRNNLNSLIHVAEAALANQVKHFIFSSSCTVYGNTTDLPVTEATELQTPESPYGSTKQMGEQIVRDMFARSQIKAVLLRYFNPAGAHPSALIGESPRNKAANLVPGITETAAGLRDELVVFGDDYPTRDGSCIRDYIHVMDLADAHTRALQFLENNPAANHLEIFNLGIGEGVSVLEAVHAFEEVSGVSLNYRIGPRRPGDVIAIYADYNHARKLLGWQPKYSIQDIMRSAWQWEKKRRGYEEK